MNQSYSNISTEAGVIATLAGTGVETIKGRPFYLSPGAEPLLIEEALLPPAHIKQSLRIDSLSGLRSFRELHGYTDLAKRRPHNP